MLKTAWAAHSHQGSPYSGSWTTLGPKPNNGLAGPWQRLGWTAFGPKSSQWQHYPRVLTPHWSLKQSWVLENKGWLTYIYGQKKSKLQPFRQDIWEPFICIVDPEFRWLDTTQQGWHLNAGCFLPEILIPNVWEPFVCSVTWNDLTQLYRENAQMWVFLPEITLRYRLFSPKILTSNIQEPFICRVTWNNLTQLSRDNAWKWVISPEILMWLLSKLKGSHDWQISMTRTVYLGMMDKQTHESTIFFDAHSGTTLGVVMSW